MEQSTKTDKYFLPSEIGMREQVMLRALGHSEMDCIKSIFEEAKFFDVIDSMHASDREIVISFLNDYVKTVTRYAKANKDNKNEK